MSKGGEWLLELLKCGMVRGSIVLAIDVPAPNGFVPVKQAALAGLCLVMMAALAVAAGDDALAQARKLLLRGKYAEAAELYSPLAEKDPAAAVGLARCLAAEGKLDEAVKDADRLQAAPCRGVRRIGGDGLRTRRLRRGQEAGRRGARASTAGNCWPGGSSPNWTAWPAAR